jgi:hypothetical protein
VEGFFQAINLLRCSAHARTTTAIATAFEAASAGR